MSDDVNFGDYRLVRTCGACPEQYDVYRGGNQVGYMRLRHGHFRVEAGGREVYSAQPRGDGIFEPDERNEYLLRGIAAIAKEMERAARFVSRGFAGVTIIRGTATD